MKSSIRRAMLLGLAFAVSACNKSAVDMSALEDRMAELETSVRKQKQLTSGLRDELARAEALLEKAKSESSATLAEIDASKKSLADLQGEFTKYRAEYKAWVFQHGPGMKYPELSAVGRTFKAVTIKSVNDFELVFLHEGGVARLMLADASKDLQDRFGYVPGTVKPVNGSTLASSPSTSNGGSVNIATPPGQSGAVNMAAGDSDSFAALHSVPAAAIGAKPGTITTDASGTHRYMTTDNGQVVEILGGGDSAGPTKSSSAIKANVPKGYKPIGSNFSGSDLGR